MLRQKENHFPKQRNRKILFVRQNATMEMSFGHFISLVQQFSVFSFHCGGKFCGNLSYVDVFPLSLIAGLHLVSDDTKTSLAFYCLRHGFNGKL